MPLNYGKQIQVIPGIQGVTAGGQAQVQINPNRRVSRLNFQCTGVAYVAPVLTLPASAGATVQPTFAVTVTQGKITGVTIVSSTATGAVNGTYQLVVTDNIVQADGTTLNNNSYAAVVNAVVAGGVVTSVTLVNGGNVAAVPIEIFFNGQILQTVGGVNMRDISATQIKAVALAENSSQTWQLGQLTIYYVSPNRRFVQNPEVTIWDLWGQSVLQLQMPITNNITAPGLVGAYEFDADATLRNTVTVGGQARPILQPIAQHAQTFPVPAGPSLFSITTVPFLLAPNTPLPILRLWLQESSPGNITQIEIDQDGNKIVQFTQAQVQQMYKDYGFNVNIFGAQFIADIDQRIAKALRCQQNLVIFVASAVTQNITIIRETLPGAFSGG
jgi:uncharacterized protein with FMN-binding domain